MSTCLSGSNFRPFLDSQGQVTSLSGSNANALTCGNPAPLFVLSNVPDRGGDSDMDRRSTVTARGARAVVEQPHPSRGSVVQLASRRSECCCVCGRPACWGDCPVDLLGLGREVD